MEILIIQYEESLFFDNTDDGSLLSMEVIGTAIHNLKKTKRDLAELFKAVISTLISINVNIESRKKYQKSEVKYNLSHLQIKR